MVISRTMMEISLQIGKGNDIMKLSGYRKKLSLFLGLCMLPLSIVAMGFLDELFPPGTTTVLVTDIDFTNPSLSTTISFTRKSSHRAGLDFKKNSSSESVSKTTSDKARKLYLAGRYRFSEMDGTLIHEGSFHADFMSNSTGIHDLFKFDIDKIAAKNVLFELDIERSESILDFFSGATFYIGTHYKHSLLD